MKSSESSGVLEEYLEEALPRIDLLLAGQGVPLWQRPFQASVIFIEHYIVEVRDDTKDDYLIKPWFGKLYRPIVEWFQKRYGASLDFKSQRVLVGAVFVHNTPFIIDVPGNITEPCLDDGKFWFCFPSSVLPDEEPLSWFASPPNIDVCPSEEKTKIETLVVEVATSLRVISVNLWTASFEDDDVRCLADGILPHLEQCARDIASLQSFRMAQAVWGLVFACEKAIKTFLRQRGVQTVKTHDLRELHELALRNGGPSDVCNALRLLPTGKVAIKYRYNEVPTPTMGMLQQMYNASITLVERYSGSLRRKYIMNNAKFLLKPFDWNA